MKLKTLLIPAIFAIAASTAVSAQDGPRGDRLASVDTNKDGEITRAEVEAGRLSAFAEIDTNGDGALTALEMEEAAERRRTERRAARFARADKDGNGTISIDEFRTGRADKRFARIDANGDGVITEDEREAARAERGGRRGRRGLPGRRHQ